MEWSSAVEVHGLFCILNARLNEGFIFHSNVFKVNKAVSLICEKLFLTLKK